MKKIISLGFVVSMLFLGGCMSGNRGPQPSTVNVSIVATTTTTPTAVYFFGLESIEQFKRLDYMELMRKKQSKLGGDIVVQSKRIMAPGSSIQQSVRIGSNVRYFAVVAGFRNVDGSDNWRYIHRVSQGSTNTLSLRLTSNTLGR
jgi:type VI secretion system VasD/TssJ family lipoprotein